MDQGWIRNVSDAAMCQCAVQPQCNASRLCPTHANVVHKPWYTPMHVHHCATALCTQTFPSLCTQPALVNDDYASVREAMRPCSSIGYCGVVHTRTTTRSGSTNFIKRGHVGRIAHDSQQALLVNTGHWTSAAGCQSPGGEHVSGGKGYEALHAHTQAGTSPYALATHDRQQGKLPGRLPLSPGYIPWDPGGANWFPHVDIISHIDE